MSNATSVPVPVPVPVAAPGPRAIVFASAADGHRVIYHEPICPTCGSFDITEDEIGTGDGITELALLCANCGTAWPVACVVEWDTPGRGR